MTVNAPNRALLAGVLAAVVVAGVGAALVATGTLPAAVAIGIGAKVGMAVAGRVAKQLIDTSPDGAKCSMSRQMPLESDVVHETAADGLFVMQAAEAATPAMALVGGLV